MIDLHIDMYFWRDGTTEFGSVRISNETLWWYELTFKLSSFQKTIVQIRVLFRRCLRPRRLQDDRSLQKTSLSSASSSVTIPTTSVLFSGSTACHILCLNYHPSTIHWRRPMTLGTTFRGSRYLQYRYLRPHDRERNLLVTKLKYRLKTGLGWWGEKRWRWLSE